MVEGIGIGFRRDIAEDLINLNLNEPSFIELAPENWIDMGGYWNKILDKAATKFPILTHGLSLSIGSPDELDWKFLQKIKQFIKDYNIEIYSEHLSYSKAENAHIYDLLPIPFRKDAIKHIVERIKKVQDFLGQQIVLENVSYYLSLEPEMDEATFIKTIIEESGAGLLLDVNNVYVNAFNHKYDAKEFIKSLPLDKVKYIHMAGHTKIDDDLIIDTHGEPIIDPVYELFEWTVKRLHPVPVLLERDFNIPEIDELMVEVNNLRKITEKTWREENVA